MIKEGVLLLCRKGRASVLRGEGILVRDVEGEGGGEKRDLGETPRSHFTVKDRGMSGDAKDSDQGKLKSRRPKNTSTGECKARRGPQKM